MRSSVPMKSVAAGTSILVSLGLVCFPAPGCAQRPDTGAQRPDSSLSADSLKKLSIEQLMNVEVTSVSKRPERLTQVASAIQVITQDDIRRSGVTSLPEALRLATNLQVARRRASGRLVTPERRMSSWVMTWMAEATCVSLSGRFETEVTSTFMSCSMLSFFRESADRLESGR